MLPSHPSHLSYLSQPLFLIIAFWCTALGVLLFVYQLLQLPAPSSLYTKLVVCVSVLYFLTLAQTSHYVAADLASPSSPSTHSEPTMDMPTATAAASAASNTAMAMDMDMDTGGACQLSMLWNWNTIDACFISSSWRITSRGMFAGSCIGVVLLVMALEMLRRAATEYDRRLVRQNRASLSGSKCASPGFRPTLHQQAIRALLHMAQFAVAYFVMLLAMYYNGYIIICIFIGAYVGSFIFRWETMDQTGATSAATEATGCCG